MRHYLDASSNESPIPTSLTLHYDDDTVVNGTNGVNGRPNGTNGYSNGYVNGNAVNGLTTGGLAR